MATVDEHDVARGPAGGAAVNAADSAAAGLAPGPGEHPAAVPEAAPGAAPATDGQAGGEASLEGHGSLLASLISGFTGEDAPGYGDILSCMHCGLCLPTCPTYAMTGDERSSPRGRIALMKGIADGRLSVSETFAFEMYFCLGCLACQTACPAGVPYGRMIEAAREQVEQARAGANPNAPLAISPLRQVARQLAFLPFRHLALLRGMGYLARFYHVSGLRRLVHRSGLLRLFGKLGAMEGLLPVPRQAPSRHTTPLEVPARGEPRARVGMLHGCIMDAMLGDDNEATVRVLAANGCDVASPRETGCCGALHAHAGDMDTARQMARDTIAAFERAGVDAVVLNSAGCGAAMKEYGHWLHDEPDWAERAAAFSAKVFDLTEWLDRIGLRHEGLVPLNAVVTYHDACHLAHGQGVAEAPRRVLKQLPGIHYVELPEANWCCGSAGIYNITHFDEAVTMLDRKMGNVARTGARIVVTGNPGCLVQLRYGQDRHDLPVEVLHTAALLDRAYGGPA